jgi:hypothetical protein
LNDLALHASKSEKACRWRRTLSQRARIEGLGWNVAASRAERPNPLLANGQPWVLKYDSVGVFQFVVETLALAEGCRRLMKPQYGLSRLACTAPRNLCTSCAAFASRPRVYRLYDFTKALLLRPGVAYSVAGKVNSADKLYLVLESVRPDTKHQRSSKAPVPADGAGGSGIG